MKKILSGLLVVTALYFVPTPSHAQQALSIKPLAEKKLSQLPAGPLFWLVENFETMGQAKSAEGPTGLSVESAGKVWLFTLGGKGASNGGAKVGEVGPIPPVVAPEYLLRVNEATGPAGSTTAIHSHPGSEAFFVLAGEQSIRSPQGIMRVQVGQSEAGQGAAVPMQVSSSGSTNLHSLVMFVVDATKPFSSPATLP
jgi:hypothetical protein